MCGSHLSSKFLHNLYLSLSLSLSSDCLSLIDLFLAWHNVIQPSQQMHCLSSLSGAFHPSPSFLVSHSILLSLSFALSLSPSCSLSLCHSFPLFLLSGSAAVKSKPRTDSFSSRPVQLVPSSLPSLSSLPALCALSLPVYLFLLLCFFFFFFIISLFSVTLLTLQGAVTSDLFDSLLALRSRCACECPRGGESECLVLSGSFASSRACVSAC